MPSINKGIDIASAAIALIHQSLEDGPDKSMLDLMPRVDHLDGTKAELKEALVYAAAQVYAYRSKTNEDASLALAQIRTTLTAFEARQASLNERSTEDR